MTTHEIVATMQAKGWNVEALNENTLRFAFETQEEALRFVSQLVLRDEAFSFSFDRQHRRELVDVSPGTAEAWIEES